MKGLIYKLPLVVILISVTGCRLQVNVLGEGSVLVTDKSNSNVVVDCADSCTKYSVATTMKEVSIAATPQSGSSFITYLVNNDVTPDIAGQSFYYGTYYSVLANGIRYENLDVQAIFHETADLAEVQTSYAIACLLSYSEGLSCWGSARDGTDTSIDAIPEEFKYPQEFEVSEQNVCILADQQVGCWGNNASLAQVPPLVNPLNLRFEGEQACVDDNSGKVCWG